MVIKPDSILHVSAIHMRDGLLWRLNSGNVGFSVLMFGNVLYMCHLKNSNLRESSAQKKSVCKNLLLLNFIDLRNYFCSPCWGQWAAWPEFIEHLISFRDWSMRIKLVS